LYLSFPKRIRKCRLEEEREELKHLPYPKGGVYILENTPRENIKGE
jgi:hypothetical protein